MEAKPIAFNARRSARLRVETLGQPPKTSQPELESPLPIEVQTPTVYQRLSQKNPAFQTLVDRLDLVEIASRSQMVLSPHESPTVSPAVEELPTDQPVLAVPAQPVRSVNTLDLPTELPSGYSLSRLEDLTALIFKPHRGYTESEASERLSYLTGVSLERSQKGIAKMLHKQLIHYSSAGEYYLSQSTPF